jgi:asparaginyl-tRNA synthetase
MPELQSQLNRIQRRRKNIFFVAFGISEEELWWYMDTRKIGSVPHAGFGLGLERMIMFVTGMTNIRDVIPFPRTPQNAAF